DDPLDRRRRAVDLAQIPDFTLATNIGDRHRVLLLRRPSAQPRGDALGPDPLLRQGREDRLLHHQCPGRGGRHQAGVPRAVPAAAVPGAGRKFLRVAENRKGQAALRGRAQARGLMALAGLWDTWRSSAEEHIRSFTIITTPPNQLCAKLHNRMPAVLKPDAWPLWLGEQPAELAKVKALLVPYPSDDMIAWPVSPRVGDVKNNDPGLVEPITLP